MDEMMPEEKCPGCKSGRTWFVYGYGYGFCKCEAQKLGKTKRAKDAVKEHKKRMEVLVGW